MDDEGESSVWSFGGRRRSRSFSGQMRRRKTMKTTGVFLYSRGETFLWWCGGWRRPESGDRMRERASPTRGERESEIMLRYERVYGTPVPLNTVHRWISDETIGWLWLARSAGWSDGLDERSFDLVWRGAPKARYTGWRGATGSNLGIFQGLRCVGIYLVFSILFLIKINILLAWRNSKKTWIVVSSLFFSFFSSPVVAHGHWLFIANYRGHTKIKFPQSFCFRHFLITVCFRCNCLIWQIFIFILFYFYFIIFYYV